MNKHPGSDQRCKIHVIGVWGGKEKKHDAEKIVEEIMENFPILKEDMSIKIQNDWKKKHYKLKEINPRHITKLLKSKDKEKKLEQRKTIHCIQRNNDAND